MRALWLPEGMDFFKKLFGYLFATGAPALTTFVTVRAGPAVGTMTGVVLGAIGARVLHLAPPPAATPTAN